jgi:predicted trehalose synthase
MVKRSVDDASERLRQIWLVYEYPGRLVRRDIARLGRMFKRIHAALAGRDQSPPGEEESKDYLWAERRE